MILQIYIESLEYSHADTTSTLGPHVRCIDNCSFTSVSFETFWNEYAKFKLLVIAFESLYAYAYLGVVYGAFDVSVQSLLPLQAKKTGRH